jgi:hypothetical protein
MRQASQEWTMADFYPLVSSAVAKLPENTAASRRALYARVRAMLARQLQSANPTVGKAEIDRERRALEEAINRVEAEAASPARSPRPPSERKAERPSRAAGGKRMMMGVAVVVVIACALAGSYFVYAHFGSRTSDPPIAAVPAGDDAMAIKGVLADYRGAASKPPDVLLLHVRCGATVIEHDAQSKPINPSGHLDDQGRFSIAVKKTFLGEIVKVGVRATAAAQDELHQDFLVLGFFADDKLELLTGADGKTVKISPQGQILNAATLNISSVGAPAMIVTRKPDGSVYASGGALAFDDAC